MMLEYGNERIKKAKQLLGRIEELGLTGDEVLNRYCDKNFKDGYSKFNVFREVLLGTPSEDTLEYLEKRLGGNSLGHNRDTRNAAQYGADLILSWLFEDTILVYLNRRGVRCELSGSDKDREFLHSQNVSASADMVVGLLKRPLELVLDNTGYWQSGKPWDARDDKWNKALGAQSIVLGVDIKNFKGFLLDLRYPENYTLERIKKHHVYQKPAIAVKGINNMLNPLSKVLDALCVSLSQP